MGKVKGCSCIEGRFPYCGTKKERSRDANRLSERKPTTFCANVLPQVPHNYPQDKYVEI